MFLADLPDTQLHTQLTEAITRQRLRQDISQLLLSADVLNVHLPIPNALSNEMIAHIYMFTSIVETGFLLSAIADWLSIFRMKAARCLLFNSASSCASQTP